MTPTPLTERQRDVLRFIKSRRTIPPTYHEIMRHFGWTGPNSVATHLKALVRKGCLEVEFGKDRGLTLTKAGKRAVGIPLVTLEQLSDG